MSSTPRNGKKTAWAEMAGFTAILLNDPLWSPLLILLGAFFDLFDGMVARALKVSSEFGKQIDSLADMVSFGVAPAYLYYFHIMPEQSVLTMILVAFIPAFSGIRLAIFNIDESQTSEFKGLPTPGNAIFFLSFPLLKELVDTPIVQTVLHLDYLLMILPVVFGFLLVVPLRMFSFKTMAKGPKKNPLPFILVLLVILAAVFIQWMAIPLSIVLYIFLSVIGVLFTPVKGRKSS
mgnify:CR=1 FL=1